MPFKDAIPPAESAQPRAGACNIFCSILLFLCVFWKNRNSADRSPHLYLSIPAKVQYAIQCQKKCIISTPNVQNTSGDMCNHWNHRSQNSLRAFKSSYMDTIFSNMLNPKQKKKNNHWKGQHRCWKCSILVSRVPLIFPALCQEHWCQQIPCKLCFWNVLFEM